MSTGRARSEQFLALAVGGERKIAQIRLAVVAIICCIPIAEILSQQHIPGGDPFIDLCVASVALVFSAVAYIVAYKIGDISWFSYLTACMDVTLVSLALGGFLLVGTPQMAVNSRVVWGIYLLAIAATGLRPRPGIAITATVLAVAEYLCITLYVYYARDLQNSSRLGTVAYGTFNWNAQSARLLLLAATGLLSTWVARCTERLAHLAGADALTGAYNRAFFMLRLREELQRSLRHGRSTVIALIDVDHLKTINDQFGHELGDWALVQVVQSLRTGLRASDNVFRYGGDEIAVLMPELTISEAKRRLARIAEKIRSTAQIEFPLTVSIGIVSYPEDGQVLEGLLRTADRRLYLAKQRGRDQVVGPTQEDLTAIGVHT